MIKIIALLIYNLHSKFSRQTSSIMKFEVFQNLKLNLECENPKKFSISQVS